MALVPSEDIQREHSAKYYEFPYTEAVTVVVTIGDDTGTKYDTIWIAALIVVAPTKHPCEDSSYTLRCPH